MGQPTPIQVRSLESFDQLENAISGSHRNTVQIDRGRMRGQLTHLSIGGEELKNIQVTNSNPD